MQQQSSDLSNTESEPTFDELLGFLSEWWKLLLGAVVAGVLGAAIFIAVIPRKFEASAIIEMAQIGIANGQEPTLSGNNVEAPALLIERLKSPSTYTPAAIEACGHGGVASAGEAMAREVKATVPKNLGAHVEVRLAQNSPQLAKDCLAKVIEMVREQQTVLAKPFRDELRARLDGMQERLRQSREYLARLEKGGSSHLAYLVQRDESIYLFHEIDQLQRTMSRDVQTRLIAPIYAPEKAVYPKRMPTLFFGAIAGLMSGLLLSFGLKVVRR